MHETGIRGRDVGWDFDFGNVGAFVFPVQRVGLWSSAVHLVEVLHTAMSLDIMIDDEIK